MGAETGNAETGGGAVLTIDLDAVVANWRTLAARAAPAECAAVLKADAYGLGVAAVAPVLARAGCRTFFVALLREARALAPHLPADARILVLNGVAPGEEAECARRPFIPVINSLEQLARWREAGAGLPLALQVDTGMSRFGLSPAEVATLAAEPSRAAGLRPAVLMSHLGCADQPEHPLNARQLARFGESCAALEVVMAGAQRSLAASSGIFLPAAFHGALVRPGAALYGIAPRRGEANPMRPVVRLEARVVQVRRIAAGESVGYGATFTAAAPTTIGTVAVGYADGFLRAGSNRGAVATPDGRILPIAGLVSMDSITVAGDGLREGDTVELIGPHRPLAVVADDAGTISYELLTNLGRRYARRIVGGDAR